MKLFLKGHDYKYAVEQIMLVLFPAERPEYPDDEADVRQGGAAVSLSAGKKYTTAHTRLYAAGRIFDGYARAETAQLTEKLLRDRLLQKIIKLSFYRAATRQTGAAPVWGALTGIRPGKIVTGLLEAGQTPARARRTMERTYFVSPERAQLCLDTARTGLAVKAGLAPRDIALYVGIPFCPTRCAYCSFVSHSVEKSMKLIPPFLEALFQEIRATAQVVSRLSLRPISLYIGGGTPTTLSPDQLRALLLELQTSFDLSALREFTVEAGRPDTITREKMEVLRDFGVSRISINPQSLSDDVLAAIGRRHSAADVYRAFEIARSVSPAAINMDLIAGLPADTVSGFRKTLDGVLALAPENITVHTLSLKRGTRITLEGTTLPTPAQVGEMLDYGAARLRAQGYGPYYLYRQKFISGGFENTGWSRPGQESLYNICIMEELCTILAMGGGASTKLTAPRSGRIERIFNAKYPYEYIENIERTLADKEKICRFYEKEVI